MTLAFMIMSSMTMMTLNLYSGWIVIVGSPDGKSGTPTFVKSVVFSRFDNKIKIINWKLNIRVIVISSSLSSSKRVLTKKSKKGEWDVPYTILRFKKDKGGAIAGCERHNERKKKSL